MSAAVWRQHALPRERAFLVPPAMAATEASVYLYGGIEASGTSRAHTELWRLELATGLWSLLPTGAAKARRRRRLLRTRSSLRNRLLLVGAREPSRRPPQLAPPGGPEEEGAEPATPCGRSTSGQEQRRGACGGAEGLARVEHCVAHERAASCSSRVARAPLASSTTWSWEQRFGGCGRRQRRRGTWGGRARRRQRSGGLAARPPRPLVRHAQRHATAAAHGGGGADGAPIHDGDLWSSA